MNQYTFSLLSHLESDEEDIRREALQELVEAKEKAAIRPILQRLTKTRDKTEVLQLIIALGELRAISAAPRLLQRLQRSQDGEYQEALLTSLLQINAPSSTPRLRKQLQRLSLKTLQRSFHDYFCTADDFLQTLQENGCFRWLTQQILQKSTNPNLGLEIIGKIWQDFSPSTRKILCEALLHPIDLIRTAALDALHRRNEHREAKRFLLPYTRAEDSDIRQRAFHAMLDLATPRDLRHLRHGLVDESPVVRRLALKLLHRHAPKRASAYIEQSLQDDHPSIRQMAILSITPELPKLYPRLVQALKDPTRLVQSAAVQALCNFPSQETEEALLHFLQELQQEIQKKSHPYSIQTPSKDELGVSEREALRAKTLDTLESIGLSQSSIEQLWLLWQDNKEDLFLRCELLYTLGRRGGLAGVEQLLASLEAPELCHVAQATFEDLDQASSHQALATLFPSLSLQKKFQILQLSPRHRTDALESLLLRAMHEQDPALRIAAFQQFSQLKSNSPNSQATDEIWRIALRDPSQELRSLALSYKRSAFSSSHIEALLDLLHDPSKDIQAATIEQLGHCDKPQVQEALQILIDQAFSHPKAFANQSWKALLDASYQRKIPMDAQKLFALYEAKSKICKKLYQEEQTREAPAQYGYPAPSPNVEREETRIAILRKLGQDADTPSLRGKYIKVLQNALSDHRLCVQEGVLTILREAEETALLESLEKGNKIDHSLVGDIFYTRLWLAPERLPLQAKNPSLERMLVRGVEGDLGRRRWGIRARLPGSDQRWRTRRVSPREIPWFSKEDDDVLAELALAKRLKDLLFRHIQEEKVVAAIKAHAQIFARIAGHDFEACLPGTTTARRFDAWWDLLHYSPQAARHQIQREEWDAPLFEA